MLLAVTWKLLISVPVSLSRNTKLSELPSSVALASLSLVFAIVKMSLIVTSCVLIVAISPSLLMMYVLLVSTAVFTVSRFAPVDVTTLFA